VNGAIGPVVTGPPPPTPVFRTTRPGSRRHVRWLNQPACSGKGEPGRRSACACARARIVTPGAKAPSPRAAVLDASPLLVILHYLLKNNTTFMVGYVQGRVSTLDLLSTCKFTSGGAQPW
jgi:hypothetical protein